MTRHSIHHLLLYLVVIAFSGCSQKTESIIPYDYCEGEVPDLECFSEKRDPQSEQVDLARRIADLQIQTNPASEIRWDWGESVLMAGIVQLYKTTRDTRYRDYFQAWMDHHIETGYEIATSDTCAPAIIAVELYREFQDEKYRTVVLDALKYLYEDALRTEEGGINHLGINAFAVTLWVDSLYMFGNLLSSWGEVEQDQAALALYEEQFRIFAAALQDASGLYYHWYKWGVEDRADVLWARGNSWVTASGYDYLRIRRLQGSASPFVQAAMRKQAEAILSLQDSDTGLWWTIVDEPGYAYIESSASALFAYGLARGFRYGFLGEEVLPAIERAMEGLKTYIREDASGTIQVHGISGPTTAGQRDDYAAVGVFADIHYGIGAVIFALTETSGLPAASP